MTPDGWVRTTLGKAARIIMGTSPPGSSYNADGNGMPLLNGPAEFGPRHPTPVQWTTTVTRTCEPGDLLLCVRGSTTGRQNVADREYCIGRGLAAIKGTNDAHGSFLQATLEWFAEAVLDRARGAGSTFPNFNAKELHGWAILLPPLPEQKKIAAILGSVDEAIAATQAVIDQTRKVKQGLLQQLLTRGIGHTRFKNTEIGEIPEEWEIKRVEDIATVIRGSSPRPKGDRRYYGGCVPRLMVADVTRDKKYITPTIDSLTEEGAKLSRPMPAGSLVIVCSGTVGVPGILAVDACIHDGFLALGRVANECDIEFLFYVFSPLQQELDALATHGGVFTNLTTQILREFEIALPSLSEQKQIAGRMGLADEQIMRQEEALAGLENLKRGLMQDLLTGRVRVKGVA